MQWFGISWGAPVCDVVDHRETPIGWVCGTCTKFIESGDQGIITPLISLGGASEIAYHLDCFLKSILGDTHPGSS